MSRDGQMTESRLIVLSNAVAGRDDAFNRWYDDVHLADVVAVPGVTAAQRFTLAPGEAWAYAAIYEIAAGDPEAVVADIVDRWSSGRMRPTDAFDMDSYRMVLATPLGPRRIA